MNIKSSSSINQLQLQPSSVTYILTVHSFNYRSLQASSAHHFLEKEGFMRTPVPKQHLPQHQSLAAMPILQRIWLISKHAHEVKATENRIREIHILWESPAFCGPPFLDGFGGDFSRIGLPGCNVSSLHFFSGNILWHRMDIRYT